MVPIFFVTFTFFTWLPKCQLGHPQKSQFLYNILDRVAPHLTGVGSELAPPSQVHMQQAENTRILRQHTQLAMEVFWCGKLWQQWERLITCVFAEHRGQKYVI